MADQVVIGLLGSTLDQGKSVRRWERWRPSVAVCQHENLLVKRFELLYPKRFRNLAEQVREDILLVSPETTVNLQEIFFRDPWDFQEVYGALLDYACAYPFKPESEEYLVHITTGTHVAQICEFLLVESHFIPGKLLQTSPHPGEHSDVAGTYTIIDLDLSRYDKLAARFRARMNDDISFLKAGIETRNPVFNRLMEQIEKVAGRSRSPILLAGPTGAGKSQLARRIYALKKHRRLVEGELVEVNCATIRGDGAMSALFGHIKGAFTGAVSAREGLLRRAHGGLLFLDEVGELGPDEQAMLLRAIEEKVFIPVGSDREERSDFQLICGTNRDLQREVRQGRFREDLLARLNLWTFTLPGLRERPEDIEPNLQYELNRFAEATGEQVSFSKEARHHFLDFAASPAALWTANFRDLNACLTRLATLSDGGRITEGHVEDELTRLRAAWQQDLQFPASSALPQTADFVTQLLGEEAALELDLFDRLQLHEVIRICRSCRTLSEAGRLLFSESRKDKGRPNDTDRLRKYLIRFGLTWDVVQG